VYSPVAFLLYMLLRWLSGLTWVWNVDKNNDKMETLTQNIPANTNKSICYYIIVAL
jgi:hypothetical protein